MDILHKIFNLLSPYTKLKIIMYTQFNHSFETLNLINRSHLHSTTFLDPAFLHYIHTCYHCIPNREFLRFMSATFYYDDKTLFVLCFMPVKYRQFI